MTSSASPSDYLFNPMFVIVIKTFRHLNCVPFKILPFAVNF